MPNQTVNTIYDIDLDRLAKAGKKGIITDLDNTLVGAGTPDASPEVMRWLKLVKEKGFQVVIVSNNSRMRVSAFAEPLHLPYIARAKKPMTAAFRQALNIMTLSERESVVVGDQLLTDVLGGNRMGLHTILVVPIAPEEEAFTTKFNRRIERMIMAWLRKSGKPAGEEEHS